MELSIDPVMINIGPIAIRWYSIAYIIGIMFAYWYIPKIDKQKIFRQEIYDSLLLWSVISIILGGRIGYILFYNLGFYINYPTEIVKIWHGGMSFHGGMIGFIISIIIFCKKNKIPILPALDLLSCATPIGIFLGRIANFINGELYGKVTNVPWAIIFLNSGNSLPRHPSQLYEAFFEGLLLFIISNSLIFFTTIREHIGALFSVSILWYAISRFTIELFREPDAHIGYILFNKATMGQVLSLPMIILGISLFIRSVYKKRNQNNNT